MLQVLNKGQIVTKSKQPFFWVKWREMTWNDVKWREMLSNGMKWHEMAWNGMKWHEMSWNGMICRKMPWNNRKWHEMAWNGMKWYEMTWIDSFGWWKNFISFFLHFKISDRNLGFFFMFHQILDIFDRGGILDLLYLFVQ